MFQSMGEGARRRPTDERRRSKVSAGGLLPLVETARAFRITVGTKKVEFVAIASLRT
jgi:hypothetical protein